jgi:hypothetical protein
MAAFYGMIDKENKNCRFSHPIGAARVEADSRRPGGLFAAIMVRKKRYMPTTSPPVMRSVAI